MPTEPHEPRRRLMAADSFERVTNVVLELRRHGYTPLGAWSLPQNCHHLAAAIESMLTRPASLEPTSAQAAGWSAFLAEKTSPAGIPPGLPTTLQPPPDCGDEQVDRLIAAGWALATWPHSHVSSSRFGPVPVDGARRFHLAHVNHHLSFLLPKPVGRAGLEYADVHAALADVARLRHGYDRAGQWSLAQVAYHVAASLKERMRPEAAGEPDRPEQRARIGARDRVLNGNVVAAGLTAPPQAMPPADLTDDSDAGRSAIDGLVDQLQRLEQYPHEFPPHRLFGRMTREQNHRHQLVHAAHHLSHLVPT